MILCRSRIQYKAAQSELGQCLHKLWVWLRATIHWFINCNGYTQTYQSNSLIVMDLCLRLNSLFLGHSKKCENHVSNQRICSNKGLVKGEKFCFRYPDFYFWHGESTSSASQQTYLASQLSKEINKVPLILQNLHVFVLTS